jgi:deoxyribonuclease-4
MPAAGGVANALIRGDEIGCTAIQLFTSSPQQRGRPLREDDIRRYHEARELTGIGFVVAHDSYLINLASPDTDRLAHSRSEMRGEVGRAEELGIPWVITHMGAHTGSGEAEGLCVLAASIAGVLRETSGMRAGIALEVTAGQGTSLGHRFEHIAYVLHVVGADERLAVCFDTCHAFAAGYDLRDEDSYNVTIGQLDAVIGLDRLRIIHANDAKRPLGSRVDRHEHIGRGHIGLEAFRRLVTDQRLLHVPIILETPESETMHRVNLRRLRGLTRSRRRGNPCPRASMVRDGNGAEQAVNT